MSRKPNLENREKILKSAARLFHEKGYRGVSMEDVARAAGLKKANLFHYYPTKETLGLSVFEYATLPLKEKIVAQFSQTKGDPIESIKRIFSESMSRMKENRCCRGCFAGNLAQELSDHNENLREKISEYFGFWTEQIAGYLGRARTRGYFKKDLKPRESAQAIVASLEGSLILCKASKSTASIENARNQTVVYLKIYTRG